MIGWFIQVREQLRIDHDMDDALHLSSGMHTNPDSQFHQKDANEHHADGSCHHSQTDIRKSVIKTARGTWISISTSTPIASQKKCKVRKVRRFSAQPALGRLQTSIFANPPSIGGLKAKASILGSGR